MKVTFNFSTRTYPISEMNLGEVFILAKEEILTNPSVYMKISRNGHIDYVDLTTGQVKIGQFNNDTPVVKCNSELKIQKIS